MNTPNKQLMHDAYEALRGKWRLAIKVAVIYFLIHVLIGAIPGIGSIAGLLITGPLLVGFSLFWLRISRRETPAYTIMFSGFDQWVRALKTFLLLCLYILLWTLLFIVPGIVAAFAYSQTFYILAEDREIGARAALRKSRELMNGKKWKLFRLNLRFLGWMLLGILSLGIGFLWIGPYISTAMARFYDDLRDAEANATNETVSTAD